MGQIAPQDLNRAHNHRSVIQMELIRHRSLSSNQLARSVADADIRSVVISIFTVVTLWTLPVSAQPDRSDSQSNPSVVDPKACAPSERLSRVRRDPQPPASRGEGETTTDKLRALKV